MESKYQTGRFPALLQVSWVTSGKSPTLKWLGGVITRELNHSTSSFTGGSVVKNPPVSARDTRDAGSIPGSGRSPGGGNGNPLQYSCLENPMGRGARCKSRAQLSTQRKHTASFWLLRPLAFAGGCCLQACGARGPGLSQHPPVRCSWSEGQQWILVHALVWLQWAVKRGQAVLRGKMRIIYKKHVETS